MDKITQSDPVSKLCAMVDNVVIRRDQYKRAPAGDKARAFGRLDKSISEAQEANEKCRKSGKAES